MLASGPARGDGRVSEARAVEVGRDVTLGGGGADPHGLGLREDDPARAVVGVLDLDQRGRG